MDHLFTVENLVAFLTLTSLEIVLGIDNIVFLAILTGRLDPAVQKKARLIGLSLAMIMRVLLLLSIKWIMGLTTPWFSAVGFEVTGRALILVIGGLFLIAKATHEIHERIEGGGVHAPAGRKNANFAATLVQIVAIDLVFSLDSVITAVGMAQHLETMIAAVIVAVFVMMAFAGTVSAFVEKHPTIKMLALAFLLLIGVMLVAEGAGRHIERGYIYFAMAFSLMVEMLNIKAGRRQAT